VRRTLEKFELMQIWITDPSLGDLAEKQAQRMLKEFDTISIPLHVVLAPDGTELARFTYSPLATADDYVKFLEEGLAKFAAR
jgi:pyridoxal/pyridoxine/pyridoxamine kinase